VREGEGGGGGPLHVATIEVVFIFAPDNGGAGEGESGIDRAIHCLRGGGFHSSAARMNW